jgi:hypothetical protein
MGRVVRVRRSAFLTIPVLCLALTGCGWIGAHQRNEKPDGFTLHGYVSVAGSTSGTAGAPCTSPLKDVRSGAEVEVVDEGGKPLSNGSLGDGVLAQDGSAYKCNFPFDVAGVTGSGVVLILVGVQPAVRFEVQPLREGKPAVVPVALKAATASPSPS